MKFRMFLAVLLSVIFACSQGSANDKRSVLIELDGSSSTDSNGDRLKFKWVQVAGPSIKLSDNTSAKPHFRTSKPGVYKFELTVSDGRKVSEPSVVEIEVARANLPPEAVVPKLLTAEPGEEVLISGARSRDGDNDKLTYHWRQVSGDPLYLSDEVCAAEWLSFIAKKEGVYEFELIVKDKLVASKPARARVEISKMNLAPVARIVAPRKAVILRPAELVGSGNPEEAPIAVIKQVDFAKCGGRVILDGRGSLSQGKKTLKYYWKQKSGDFVRSFERKEDGLLSFVPQKVGDYQFELIVNDGKNDSRAATINITVDTKNSPPVAVAKVPKEVLPGTRVELDGSESYDRENEKLKYYWKQVSGPRITKYSITEKGSAAPAFVPQIPGKYIFELAVADSISRSPYERVTILVSKGNVVPQTRVTSNLEVEAGQTALLQGSAKDEDGDLLQYSWTQVSGIKLIKKAAPQRNLSVTPKIPGLYVFEFTASDGKDTSKPRRVTIKAIDKISALIAEEPQVTTEISAIPRRALPTNDVRIKPVRRGLLGRLMNRRKRSE